MFLLDFQCLGPPGGLEKMEKERVKVLFLFEVRTNCFFIKNAAPFWVPRRTGWLPGWLAGWLLAASLLFTDSYRILWFSVYLVS